MTVMLFDLAGADPDVRFSPYCWRTKMALKHKGVVFEAVPWRFTDKVALEPSGQGRVPTIVDHGLWVHDSWEIAHYLDRAYPDKPILFRDARDEAAARFMATWADMTLHLPILRICLVEIYAALAPQDQAYFRSSREARFGVTLEEFVTDKGKAKSQLLSVLSPMDVSLRASRFLGGETPSYSDYAVFGSLMWPNAVMSEPLLEADTMVGAWFNRMLGLHDGYARSAKIVRG
ncbi:MAG: glutathione S-transferase family protein [Hyphomicrobiaceae bacterium]|nr:glutathione S-transferase family protein [Hyphomicrobiaceae bacterium]